MEKSYSFPTQSFDILREISQTLPLIMTICSPVQQLTWPVLISVSPLWCSTVTIGCYLTPGPNQNMYIWAHNITTIIERFTMDYYVCP